MKEKRRKEPLNEVLKDSYEKQHIEQHIERHIAVENSLSERRVDMSEQYQPAFHMTDEITNLVIGIGERAGAIDAVDSMNPNPRLRRESRIRTIHSSLAIEQNTLTLEQVTDVINGKRVLGHPAEIKEVKNAYEAYERVSVLEPYSVKNLLLAHRIMMDGLTKEAGRFRSGNVGVYAGKTLIHAGSPAKYVPDLIRQLFGWLKKSELHPLIKSCVFHYEFEFIHPFSDGNGRTGRLWQSLILQKWMPLFAYLPVETLVYEQQQGYYKALADADKKGDATIFVTFMLKIILAALQEIDVGTNVGINVGTNEEKVLALLSRDGTLTAKALAGTLGITVRQVERIIAKCKQDGTLIRHGASKNGYWEVQRHV